MKISFSPDHLLMTKTGDNVGLRTAQERANELHQVLLSIQRSFQDRRRVKTDRMLECWAAYLGTPEAQDYLRADAIRRTVGDVEKDWRHKINSGKAYDIVETIVGYLMGATFPNKDWFDMVPQAPLGMDEEYAAFVRVMKAFLNGKLEESHFKTKWETFLRQLVITGTSVISLPWVLDTRPTYKNVKVRVGERDVIRQETVQKVIYNAPMINVEDMLDLYLDPDADDPNCADMLRRMVKTKAEVMRLIENETYNLADKEDIKRCKYFQRGKSDNRIQFEHFQGISGQQDWHPSDKVEVWEFWGKLQLQDMELADVVVTFTDNTILRCETNPYWGGKPFIVGTFTQVLNSPYGMGALEPALGALHAKDIIANNRLDAIEITVNPMWMFRNDGTVDPNDIYSEPGRLIPVSDMNSISPMPIDRNFQGMSVQEETLLEQKIDKTTGTGAFVGSGVGRSGERVTATEVQAVRDAGGNRLSNVHAHIEDTSLLPFLQRAYQYAQQYVVDPEIVRARGNVADEWWYAEVGIDQLSIDFSVLPMGSKHVADKEFELRMRSEWIATITSVPEMAQLVNWGEVAKDVTARFTGEEAKRFIMDAPPEQPAPEEPSPQDQLAAMQAEQAMAPTPQEVMVEGAGQVGGKELAMALQGQIAADGGQQALGGMMGAPPPEVPVM